MGDDGWHARALRGVAGPGGGLPHGAQIQAAFGRFDVQGVTAHVGGDAAAAADGMGASAYAVGEDVAFAGPPDLHTAAHEAAHVVQQRRRGAAVEADTGFGASAAHERHADAVADAVVRGESAEALLAKEAGTTATGVVQRKESDEQAPLAESARRDAQTLLTAFDGAGTDEDVVLRILNQPATAVRAIRDVYDADFNTHTGEGLAADLKYELDGWGGEEDYALAVGLMARAGISIGGATFDRHRADAGPLDYHIVADPPVQVAVPGTRITYRMHCPTSIDRVDSRRAFEWYAANDPVSSAALDKPSHVALGNGYSVVALADFPGNHKIVCRMDYTPGGGEAEPPQYFEFPQTVVPEDKAAADALGAASEPVDPSTQLELLQKFLEVMETAAGQPGSGALDPQTREAYQEQIKALQERLASTEGEVRHPFTAVHVDREQGRTSELRVFAARKASREGEETWAIVDTTNPTSRRLSGEYEGTGKDAKSAISAALAQWDGDNRYPPGRIKLEVGAAACGEVIPHEFQTDGASFWDSISEFFSEVGFWAGVGAIGVGIVTAIAPVPGSRVVSALVWTSILASSTAATINIAQRHAEGHASIKDDAMDVLTIAGNVLAGVWMRGATVLVNGQGGSKIATGILIGQVGTDGLQGIILAAEFMGQYEQIMAIKDPQQRSQQLMELFRSALLNGGMIVLSVSGTRADMQSLKQSGGLSKVTDPGHTIDLDGGTPRVDGDAPGQGRPEAEGQRRGHGEADAYARPEGRTIAEAPIQLGGETHAVRLQSFGGELRILLCSECGPIIKGFDDAIAGLEASSSRIDPTTGQRIGVGPDKSLYNRLVKLRDNIARLEADYKTGKIPPHKVQEGLNQIVSHIGDLKRAFPQFDASCIGKVLHKTSAIVPGGSATKKFLETALTDKFDVKAWEAYVTKTLGGGGERMGAVLAVAEQRARYFGWELDARVTRLNSSKNSKRVVYTDGKYYYSVDVQHGAFEKIAHNGRHLEEVDFNGNGNGKTYDDSSHNLRVK